MFINYGNASKRDLQISRVVKKYSYTLVRIHTHFFRIDLFSVTRPFKKKKKEKKPVTRDYFSFFVKVIFFFLNIFIRFVFAVVEISKHFGFYTRLLMTRVRTQSKKDLKQLGC